MPKRKAVSLKKQKQNKKKKQKVTLKGVIGHGDYAVEEVNPVINKLVKIVGGMGSSYLGMGSEPGSILADKAHRLFKRVTGFGDYKVKKNSLVVDNGAPIFKPSDRITNIRHREFVCDIKSGAMDGSSTKFNGHTYAINPSNALLFPWLSGIAKSYQQFKFNGLLFSYEGKSGSSTGPNTALGTVIMATDYQVTLLKLDIPPFKDKQQMEAHEFATSCVPGANMLHPVECDPSEQIVQHFNTFINPLTVDEDVKFYYPGIFQISTVGMPQNNINLGELWVTYDVDLLKTRKAPTTASAHFYMTGDVALGYLPPNVATKYATPGWVKVDKTNGTFIFDQSFYGAVRLSYSLHSPAAALIGGFGFNLSGNIAVDNTWTNDSANAVLQGDTSNQVGMYSFVCKGGGQLTVIAGYAGTDAGLYMDIFIDTVDDDTYQAI